MPQSVYTKEEVDALISQSSQVTNISALELQMAGLDTRLKKFENITPPTPTPTPTSGNILLEDKFDTPYILTDGKTSPDGKWICRWTAGGKVEVKDGVMKIQPRVATNMSDSLSALVISKQSFKNFQLDLDVKTGSQLRVNNPPQNWEVGQIFLRIYLGDLTHAYAFLLKIKGWQFEKKDNPPGNTAPEDEIYLQTADTPSVKIAQWQHYTIVVKDFHFTITVDGQKLVDMTDPQVNDPAKMAGPSPIGLYCEDSIVSFDNVKIVGL